MLGLTANADATAELTGWLTLVWAFLVGSATIAGVFVAVRTYTRTAWDRKVAAARLVWAQVTKQQTLEKDAEIPVRSLTFDRYVIWNSHQTIHKDAQGERATVNQRSVLLLVEITNNSDEPIGDLTLRVRDAERNKLDSPGFHQNVLPPKSATIACVVLPVAHGPNVVWSLHFVTLLFRDSAGHRWKREGTAPPTNADLPRKVLRHPLKALRASFTRSTKE